MKANFNQPSLIYQCGTRVNNIVRKSAFLHINGFHVDIQKRNLIFGVTQWTDVLYRRTFFVVRFHFHPYVAYQLTETYKLSSVKACARTWSGSNGTPSNFVTLWKFAVHVRLSVMKYISKKTTSSKWKEPHFAGESFWFFWKTHALPGVVLYDTYLK